MADENGSEDMSSPPEEEEEQVEETRRVKPLFRFGRKNSKKEAPKEVEEESPARVRPVRVVKFIPFGNKDPVEEPGSEEGTPFEEGETPEEGTPFEEGETPEEGTPFDAVEEEAHAAEADVVEEESPFLFEEDAQFAIQEEEAPFDAVEEEGEFALVPEEDPPFDMKEEEEAPFSEAEAVPVVPAVPFGTIEEVEREEPVHDSVSVQEQAETEEEFEFRQEETPATFETEEGEGTPADTTLPAAEEVKPHYHKYLKPDEELLQVKQAKGPATGFDRDMDADAGEIDFGIDLIDPSERKKKRKAPSRKDPEAGGKKGVGGHDSDSEVVTQQTGVDIGVDYQKRRKRRL